MKTMKRSSRRTLLKWCALIVAVYILYKIYHKRTLDWDGINPNGQPWIGGRIKGTGEKFDRWIVVTSIQKPTPSLKQLANIPGWKMVIVGDRKSDEDWNLPGVVFLSVEKQKALEYEVYSLLPFDSYTRKIIGYLFAIEHGAQYIYETDDDNFMDNLDNFAFEKPHASLVIDTDAPTFNPYRHFGQSTVWPRGFPLNTVGQQPVNNYKLCTPHIAAIQQGIVDGEPDVDAIFRMTRTPTSSKMNIRFDMSAPILNLPIGTFAPLNTQNTLHTYVAFWALILPTTVADRATDIYRSYWAQKLLSLTCNHISFHATSAYQKRNKWHTNVKDARDEVLLYTHIDKLVEYLRVWTCTKTFLFECMYELTKDLVYMGYLEKRDMDIISAFSSDLSSIGYSPPALLPIKSCKKFRDCFDIIYYPWEQKTSWSHHAVQSVAPFFSFDENWGSYVSELCGTGTRLAMKDIINQPPVFPDILLVVTMYSSYQLIPLMEVLYKPYFSHILYCGSTELQKVKEKGYHVTYLSLGTRTDPVTCLLQAVKMTYNVQGYLGITARHFLSVKDLHTSSRNKNQVWITGEDLYVQDPDIEKNCNSKKIHCTTLQNVQFETFKNALVGIHLPKMDDKTDDAIKSCLVKIGADPTLKQKTVINREIITYLPVDKTSLFVNLVDVYLKSSVFDGYKFLAFVIVQCMDNAPEFLHSKKPEEAGEGGHYDYLFPFIFNKSDKLHQKLVCDTIKV